MHMVYNVLIVFVGYIELRYVWHSNDDDDDDDDK